MQSERLTFSSHADLETFLESTMLTLVAMVLVDRTVSTTSTRVGEVTTHRALEEALAAFARQHAVVFAGALVTAHDTLGVQLQPVTASCLVAVPRGVCDRRDVSMLLGVRMSWMLRMMMMMVGLVQARWCLGRVMVQL